MKLATPLLSKRLVLRTLTVADATERYLGWMRDPEATRFLESRLVDHDLGSLREFILTSNDSPASLLLAICLADGTHVGNIKLGPIDPYHQHASIGLLIGERDQWGKGYATEAIVAVTDHAFREIGLEKLYAGCYASNVGSARAFLNAGWTEEGRNRAHWRSGDGREDNVQLGITRADWSARQS
jgi:RimJ/RimL family protein N-acetyltransferase